MDEDSATAPNLDTLLQHSPSGTYERAVHCCCGHDSCAFLRHNTKALEGLEKDLLSAAQIGQALLVRHENHMQEAEQERLRMTTTIEQLEADKKELAAVNAKTIEENKNLLDQLEGLNNLVSESDSQIQSLTATLQETRLELHKLTVLAGRAASLEGSLSTLELEQAQLQDQLKSSDEDTRSAMQRWKRAEGTIGHLQDQIDRIEREAREERERHVEVMARLERRRAVEKELDNAAGRLKGAAAMTNLGKFSSGGSNVVSHFVKDILQDNANLQLGIVELREMLMGSNAEVEFLREQLQLHQPLEDDEQSRPPLSRELSKAEPEIEEMAPAIKPELHVHHHYHAPEVTVKKPRKKRTAVTSGHFRSGSGASTPRAQRIRDWRSSTPSSAATILSQTSVTVPPNHEQHQHRWSMQSAQTMSSSVPSSPRRTSSIFDNIDSAFDSSRPTTPESSAPNSPIEAPRDAKSSRRSTLRSATTPSYFLLKPTPKPVKPSTKISIGDTIDEFDDPNFSDNSLPPSAPHRMNSDSTNRTLSPGPEPIPEEVEAEEPTHTAGSDTTGSYLDELSFKPQPLRRATSHESLMSVSGMDIHTLRSRPSQLLVSGMGFSPRTSLSPALSTTQAVLNSEAATAKAGLVRTGLDSGSYTRGLLAQQRGSQGGRPSLGSEASKTPLSRRVGGWVWSKWGMAPSPSTEDLRDKASKDPMAAFMRVPGVNQNGPVRGLGPAKRTPSQVEPPKVDSDALGEALTDQS